VSDEVAAECFRCGASATESFGGAALCTDCLNAVKAGKTSPKAEEHEGQNQSESRDDVELRTKNVAQSDDSGTTETDKFNALDSESHPVPSVEQDTYPDDLLDVHQWLAWLPTEDGRKVPRAPYVHRDHPKRFVDSQDPEGWADFSTVKHAADWDGFGVAFVIQNPNSDEHDHEGDPYVLIDYDDVRDPETGAIHPTVRKHVDRADSYADVSTSGTGVHIFCRGELPEGVKAVEAALPHDERFPDAEIEVYDSARYYAMTGTHLAGTPEYTTDCQAFLEELAEEFATVAEGTPDELLQEPEKSAEEIGDIETTDDFQDVLDAIQHTGPSDIRLRSTVTHERADGTKSMDPSWAQSKSGTRLAEVGDGWVYRKGMVGLDALQVVALEERIISRVDEYPSGEAFWDAVDALRERGAHIPEYESSESTSTPRVVECTPPADDLEPVDIDAVREQIRGPSYDGFVERNGAPTVCTHDPGAGKTTTGHLAASDRDRPVAYLFDKHSKAHEHRADGITPDVDLHLRGASQPREDDCARAAYEGETCDEHGDPSNCPRMCPLYDLPEGHADREAFEALAAEVGPVRAHLILEPHGGDGCAWIDEFADLDGADAVVGVHEHQSLKTVRSTGDEPRDVLVDESPGVLAEDRRLTVRDLVQLANTLEDWHGRDRVGETLRRVGRFARDVADALVAGEVLETITPPTPVVDSSERHDAAAGHYIEYVEADEDDGRTTAAPARARRAFLDHHLGAIRDPDREWDGTPLAFDALLAAAATAGLDEDLVRTVAGRPLDLDRCPVCTSELEFGGGGRQCPECAWSEQEGALTGGNPTPARILAWIDAEPHDPAEEPALVRRRLPRVDELPTDPLVLDATATPERIAALYGADQDDIHIAGAEQYSLPGAHVTQILDGQYHASTLRKAVDEDRSTARNVQSCLDRAEVVYDHPLVVGRQDVLELLDLPDNARSIHFYAVRGLNFEECDAVIVVGAPHPNIKHLRRKAELLAQGRDDLRVGGVEYSTRGDCRNPPIYRKLRYTDDEGCGRALATKHYTGLVGALFREAREKELEQVVHRVRPLLADPDDPVHVELLTNVPTSLPIDEVSTLEELAETPAAMLPVTDGALDLAGTLANIAAGEGPDGFRAAALVERDGDGVRFRIREVHRLARVTGHDMCERTVRRWIDDLEDLGLVDAGDYAPREGVPYSADGATLTRALEVLTNNADVEVAVKRQLAALASEFDSAAEWLRRASELVDICADVDQAFSAPNGGDRPPDDGD
jgi:hypothetical protein